MCHHLFTLPKTRQAQSRSFDITRKSQTHSSVGGIAARHRTIELDKRMRLDAVLSCQEFQNRLAVFAATKKPYIVWKTKKPRSSLFWPKCPFIILLLTFFCFRALNTAAYKLQCVHNPHSIVEFVIIIWTRVLFLRKK